MVQRPVVSDYEIAFAPEMPRPSGTCSQDP
jgi:hypothetical protein